MPRSTIQPISAHSHPPPVEHNSIFENPVFDIALALGTIGIIYVVYQYINPSGQNIQEVV